MKKLVTMILGGFGLAWLILVAFGFKMQKPTQPIIKTEVVPEFISFKGVEVTGIDTTNNQYKAIEDTLIIHVRNITKEGEFFRNIQIEEKDSEKYPNGRTFWIRGEDIYRSKNK